MNMDDIIAEQSELPPDYWDKVLEWYEKLPEEFKYEIYHSEAELR